MTDDEALHLEREQKELDRLREYVRFCEAYRYRHKRLSNKESVRYYTDKIHDLNTRIALQATKVGELKLKLGVLVP